MADIKQFTADIAPNPVVPYGEQVRPYHLRTGAEEFGRAMGVAVNSIANTYEADDARKIGLRIATTHANIQARLENARTNGVDPETLRQQVADDTADIESSANTSVGYAMAQKGTVGLFSSFNDGASTLRAYQAGEDLKKDTITLQNAGSTALAHNPLSLPEVYANVRNTMATYAARGIPPQAVAVAEAHVRQGLAKNALESMIAVSPEEVIKLLAKGGIPEDAPPAAQLALANLNGDERFSLMHQAQTAVHAKQYDAEHAYIQQERAIKAADEKAHQGFLSDVYGGKSSNWTDTKISSAQDISGPMKDHLIILKHQFDESNAGVNSKTKAIWAANEQELYRRAFLSPDDPNRASQMTVDQALIARRIGMQEHRGLSAALTGQDKPENKALEAALNAVHHGAVARNPLTGMPVSPGEEIGFSEFASTVREKAAALLKEGKDPSYLWTPGAAGNVYDDAIQQFHIRMKGVDRRQADELRDEAAGQAGATAARPPGGASGSWGSAPAAGAESQNPALGGATPKTKAEYDALPNGTWYIDPKTFKRFQKGVQ